jgi:hypothetical protein
MTAPLIETTNFLTRRTSPLRSVSFVQEGKTRYLYGGSFFAAPVRADVFAINLMAEHELPCDLWVPVADFSVPDSPELFKAAFDRILTRTDHTFAGCMGGIGRTGLFVGCFLRYLGHPDPLPLLRATLHPHAVETVDQKAFLDAFPLADAATLARTDLPGVNREFSRVIPERPVGEAPDCGEEELAAPAPVHEQEGQDEVTEAGADPTAPSRIGKFFGL